MAKKNTTVTEASVVTEVVAEATKKVTKSKEGKSMKKEVVSEVKNEEKKNELISIEQVVEMYAQAGIKCANPNVKGNYRIMGSSKGSSLNVKPKKGYYIYTTDADFAEISTSGLQREDLIIEEGTNSQDKSRPNTIICQTVDTLRELLALYALNPLNKVVSEVPTEK